MTGTHTGSRTTGLEGESLATSRTDEAKSKVESATETAREKGGKLQEKASDQIGNVTHQVTEKVDSRREDLADQARTLQEKAQQFATSITEEQPQLGHAIEQVVDSAGRLIDYVEKTPVEQMTQDVSQQMRSHPMLFAAGMFGAGFALTRAFRPVEGSSLGSSSTGGTRQLGSGGTRTQLPAASAIDGGMH